MAPYKYTDTKNPDTFRFGFANPNTTAVCMNLAKYILAPTLMGFGPPLLVQVCSQSILPEPGKQVLRWGHLEDKRFGGQETYSVPVALCYPAQDSCTHQLFSRPPTRIDHRRKTLFTGVARYSVRLDVCWRVLFVASACNASFPTALKCTKMFWEIRKLKDILFLHLI